MWDQRYYWKRYIFEGYWIVGDVWYDSWYDEYYFDYDDGYDSFYSYWLYPENIL